MHKPLIKSVFATLLTLTLTACWGNDPDTQAEQSAGVIDQEAIDRINATLSGFVDSGNLVGASALIREGEREVYFNAFGMADREADVPMARDTIVQIRSEEHTSELQSRGHLVCRLLLEKKNKATKKMHN